MCTFLNLFTTSPQKPPKNREWTEVDYIRCYDVSSAEAWQAHKVGKFNYFFALPLSLFAASSSNIPRFHSFQPQKSDFVMMCSSVVVLLRFLCKDKREKCKSHSILHEKSSRFPALNFKYNVFTITNAKSESFFSAFTIAIMPWMSNDAFHAFQSIKSFTL